MHSKMRVTTFALGLTAVAAWTPDLDSTATPAQKKVLMLCQQPSQRTGAELASFLTLFDLILALTSVKLQQLQRP